MNPLEIMLGIFAIILVCIYVLVGVKIILKYRETKEKTYLYFGLTWIGIVEAWYAGSVSFIVALFNGVGLQPEIYFIIGVGFYPLISVFWILAFTELFYNGKLIQKISVVIFIIIGIIYEVFFYTLLLIDPALIGKLNGPIDAQYGLFVTSFIYFYLTFLFVTGLVIGIKSIKSDVKEHKLRGIFLILALILLIIGGAIDSSMALDFITLTITRIILILSAVAFYCSFILPKPIKKVFIKE